MRVIRQRWRSSAPRVARSPQHTTSNPGHPKDRRLLEWGCMRKSLHSPSGWGIEQSVCVPNRKSLEEAGTFSGQTFCGFAQPQSTDCEDRHPVGGLRVASGCTPFGWPAGECPEAANRPLQQVRLITPLENSRNQVILRVRCLSEYRVVYFMVKERSYIMWTVKNVGKEIIRLDRKQ